LGNLSLFIPRSSFPPQQQLKRDGHFQDDTKRWVTLQAVISGLIFFFNGNKKEEVSIQ
jgi:hypothetical protein